MHYALRDYPGSSRLHHLCDSIRLVLAAMASNVAIGLYVVAVRLSEMTTLAADAIADALMPEVEKGSVEDS